jgi:trehalose 6-phosphate phosphatase
MKNLLSPEGQDALRSVSRTRALFAFDFDGTLAPIVWRPGDAKIAIGVRRRLARLAKRVPVVVISGRGVDDLRTRLPVEVQLCIGNHGNEGFPGAGDATSMRAVCSGWIARLREQLADPSADSGITVEDKGVTVSLHYRLARDRAAAAAWLSDRVSELTPPPRVIGGKLVFNLLPPGARTKFEALSELARDEGVERVLFVGDDETDELVFAQAPAEWLTVKVDLDSSSKARFFLQQQSEVTILLDQLLVLLAEPGAAQRTGGKSARASAQER